METEFYEGRRLSFEENLCTVRYVGQVAQTKGTWLGVEWDDASRGKHSGVHDGVRYFHCLSRNPKAGSFVRPNRAQDSPLSFVEAVKTKYASEIRLRETPGKYVENNASPIVISGKQVEEVGFDKIRQKLADLKGLRIVIIDALRVHRPSARCDTAKSNDYETAGAFRDVEDTCPQVVELDLSRNLFENWSEVVDICAQLQNLTSLKVSGNRFKQKEIVQGSGKVSPTTFPLLNSLFLDDTLLTWNEICQISSFFPKLSSLSAGFNELDKMTAAQLPQFLTSLNMERNDFTDLEALRPLMGMCTLRKLGLKDNYIKRIGANEKDLTHSPLIFPSSLENIDLSSNSISDWQFVDALAALFPGMHTLRISTNPLFHGLKDAEGKPLTPNDGYMLTIARLGKVSKLNFSEVLPKERFNWETYYLSQIGKQLSSASPTEASAIIASHARYPELCRQYGEPTVRRVDNAKLDPTSLAARLLRISFRLSDDVASAVEPERLSRSAALDLELPRTLSIYSILGILARKLGLIPMHLRLVWETGEEEVVPLQKMHSGDTDGEEEFSEDEAELEERTRLREEMLSPKTRAVGTWIDGSEATVRIEWSDKDIQLVEKAKQAVLNTLEVGSTAVRDP